MIKRFTKAILLIFPLVVTSCIKDGYDTENCPGQYTITPITPKELTSGKTVELKETHTTIIYPDTKALLTEVGSQRKLDLQSGKHHVIVIKGENENVKLNETIVSVASSTKGEANDPSDFLGGHKTINVPNSVPDWGTVNYDIPTLIQTRQLILKVKLDGYNLSSVEALSANISGIALTRDLNHAFVEEASEDRYPALKTGFASYPLNQKDDKGYFSASRCLLGLDGGVSQELTITVDYSGDVSKTFQFDVTEKLKGFHSQDVTSPWVIQIDLYLGADFQADVEDWIAGPEVWLDAQH